MAAKIETPEGGPKIWIVSTGTEILQGLYADTNAQWISRRLIDLGFSVERHMALPDNHAVLEQEIGGALDRADLMIMTGGLGPTADDLNRETVANLWGAPLEEDDRAVREIEERFSKRGRPMPPSNRLQALIPRGAVTLYNEWGTAPGFFLRPPAGGVRAALLALPGPPREMNPMFDQIAAPLLLEAFASGKRRLRVLTLHTVGLPESHVNEQIADLFGSDPRVNVALLAGKWRVDVRLTLAGVDDAENEDLAGEWRGLIADRLGIENIFGEDATGFEDALGDMLRHRGQTLATAESCTGGLIAKRLTDIPGSSDYFLEGFVTYSNRAKMARLGVPSDVLEEYGAVSAETAEAMAHGAKRVAGTDWALSVTGVAGPGGGTETKPVGLVWFGIAAPDGTVKTRKILGLSDRTAIRELASLSALDMLRRAILKFR